MAYLTNTHTYFISMTKMAEPDFRDFKNDAGEQDWKAFMDARANYDRQCLIERFENQMLSDFEIKVSEWDNTPNIIRETLIRLFKQIEQFEYEREEIRCWLDDVPI